MDLLLIILGICLFCWLAPQGPPAEYLATTKPFKPRSNSVRKKPTKPQFVNSKPNPGAKRPPQPVKQPPPMPQVTFEQIQQELARRERGSLKVEPQTERRLYQMLGNDAARVGSLTELTRSRNPRRSEQWVWEKTIYDLERDRGYR